MRTGPAIQRIKVAIPFSSAERIDPLPRHPQLYVPCMAGRHRTRSALLPPHCARRAIVPGERNVKAHTLVAERMAALSTRLMIPLFAADTDRFNRSRRELLDGGHYLPCLHFAADDADQKVGKWA